MYGAEHKHNNIYILLWNYRKAYKMLSVSLIIPVKNEEMSIDGLLLSINSQSYRYAQVIFVDGGSLDNTVQKLRVIESLDAKTLVLKTCNSKPGEGRNLGIASANNNWIALTDAGIRLEPDWLERLIEVTQADSTVDVVYGNYEPEINTFFERCAALAYVPPKVLRPGGLMRGPSIASCLLKKSVWEKVGGFPEWRAAEDLIFMRRVEESDFRIAWAPKATVWWQLRPDLKSTFQKFVLYSRHNVWASMQHDWHYGVARQYAVYLIAILMMGLHSAWWGLVPVLAFAARTMKSIWVRREGRGILWALNPVQFLGVAGILLTIDLAMFIGWVEAIWRRDGDQRQDTKRAKGI